MQKKNARVRKHCERSPRVIPLCEQPTPVLFIVLNPSAVGLAEMIPAGIISTQPTAEVLLFTAPVAAHTVGLSCL